MEDNMISKIVLTDPAFSSEDAAEMLVDLTFRVTMLELGVL